MAHIDRRRTVAAAVPDVWRVLADFGAVNTWFDKVDHCCLLKHSADGPQIGTTRRVQIGREVLVERITEFDPPHVLAYEIEGLPRAMGRVRNRWTLQPADSGTVVTVRTTVEIGSGRAQQLAERVVCRVMARGSDDMLAGLADRLEKSRVCATRHRHHHDRRGTGDTSLRGAGGTRVAGPNFGRPQVV